MHDPDLVLQHGFWPPTARFLSWKNAAAAIKKKFRRLTAWSLSLYDEFGSSMLTVELVGSSVKISVNSDDPQFAYMGVVHGTRFELPSGAAGPAVQTKCFTSVSSALRFLSAFVEFQWECKIVYAAGL